MNTQKELLHVGVAHDENPPGRGSGRYPYGSGDRPFQGSKARQKIKSLSKTDVQHLHKIKRVLQMSSFVLDAKMTEIGLKKYSKQYEAGMSYLSGFDKDFSEVEARKYGDGHIEFFPPASIIDSFLKEGLDNPYPKDESLTFYDEMKRINPDFGSNGTTKNCTKAAAAVEMNRRGYDVQAGRQTDSGDIRSIMNWFKDSTLEKESYDNLENTLSSFGDNASGILRIKYKDTDSGHAVHWSIEDGKLQIEDGQNGRVYGSKQYKSSDGNNWFNALDNPLKTFLKEYDVDTDSKCIFSRLDNCEPNFDSMAEDSVIRRGYTLSAVKNKITGNLTKEYPGRFPW